MIIAALWKLGDSKSLLLPPLEKYYKQKHYVIGCCKEIAAEQKAARVMCAERK
jgi:hypothetical protein